VEQRYLALAAEVAQLQQDAHDKQQRLDAVSQVRYGGAGHCKAAMQETAYDMAQQERQLCLISV
jgi:hypothetical protein